MKFFKQLCTVCTYLIVDTRTVRGHSVRPWHTLFSNSVEHSRHNCLQSRNQAVSDDLYAKPSESAESILSGPPLASQLDTVKDQC